MSAASPKKPAIVIAVCAVWLAAFWALRGNKPRMTAFARNVTAPFKRGVGFVCGLVPFSVAELVWAAFILFCLWYIGKAVYDVARGGNDGKAHFRPRLAAKKLLCAAAIALCVYSGFTLLWGVDYYTETFEERAGLTARPIYAGELAEVTRLFALRVNETAYTVTRDESGVFTADEKALFARSKTLYRGIARTYPFLETPYLQAKPMLLSEVMSQINYTGFFFPFTGEANLNANAPTCFLPATIAHELAHVRGVAPEQTANFLAILACEASGDADYVYSGYLFGYLHLSNALYRADRQAYLDISASLCEGARADLAANDAYWNRYKTPVAAAANTVYEGFLQSYEQELGMKSYGAVVDLLVAYYGEAAD